MTDLHETDTEAPVETYLTVPDGARVANISRSKMWSIVADGRVPSIKLDGRRLIRRSDLDAFLGSLVK